METRKEYFNNLDGLRAFAVSSVLLFHSGIITFWYGWVGVQIFFVLSGFLITNILLKNKNALNFFTVFYLRRALRIFPSYYLVLFLSLVYCFRNSINFSDFYKYILYIQNYPLGFYKWNINAPIFLNHTWSLAVEEQFYLFFPAMVFFLNRNFLVKACVLIIFLSVALKLVLIHLLPNNPINWVNTISCLDFLLCGALISIYSGSLANKKLKKFLLGAIIISTIIYLLVTFFCFKVYPFKFPFSLETYSGVLFLIWLLPTASLFVFYLSYANNRFIKVIFCNRVVKYIGKVSYGIYLYHYIVFYFVDKAVYSHNIFLSNSWLFLFKASITLLLSILSWELFERKVLVFKKSINYKFLLLEN